MSDRDQDLALQAVQDAGLDPLDPTTMEPSTLVGLGVGTGTGLMRGAAKAARGAMVLAGGTVGAALDTIANAGHRARGEPESTGFRDNTFQAADEIGQNAVDYWTPGPNEVGKAGQVLGGLAEIVAPLAAGGGNPSLLMATSGTNTGADLVDQGVDGNTASGVAAADIAATGFGFKIPFLGKTLLTRALTGAAGNVAINAGATEISHAALQSGGYTDIAGQYDPLDPTARTVDVLTGLGFGAIAHASAKTSDVDAALTARNAEHFQETAHPGTPVDARSSMLAQTALSTAIEQALRGDRVDIASHIRAADFMAPVTTEGQPIGEALASIEGSPQHVQLSNYAAFRHALESGGKANAANPNSSAVGIDQFTETTWRRIVAKGRPAWAEGLNDAQLLAARTDPVKSAEMVAVLDHENATALRAAGQPVDSLNLYAAHHFGATHAIEFARAGADTPLSQILTHSQLEANPYLAGMTKGEVVANWIGRAKRAGVHVDGSPVDTDPAGQALRRRLVDEHQQLVNEYAALPESNGGVVLNTDVARELAPEYAADRTRSADVHEAASDTIKHIYETKLAGPTPDGMDPVVLFTAGGTGAGKTTGVKLLGGALGNPEIVYDTNMSTLHSAVAKVEQALEAGRRAEILYVYRDPVEALTGGAIPRAERMKARLGSGRTVPIDEHAKTHVGARQVMDALAEKYRDDPRVQVTAVDNSRGQNKAAVVPLETLPAVAENGLREALQHQLEAAREAGLDEDLYRGFAGASGRGEAQPRSSGQARAGVRGEPESLRRNVSSEPAAPPLQAVDHLAAEHPDAPVIAAGFDEDGNPRYSTVADARADIEAEHAKAIADAKAFEAAVNCHLRRGPDHAG